jgi:hypothetical protein
VLKEEVSEAIRALYSTSPDVRSSVLHKQAAAKYALRVMVLLGGEGVLFVEDIKLEFGYSALF